VQPLILIVEDEEAIATLLRYNLEREGFKVAVARDGEEGLAALAEHRPDLAIVDWMLPYVSGLELCRQIRRRPETHGLPVIMLTARGEEADRVRGLDAGADDYIAKPFSTTELLARVRAVLRRAHPAFGDNHPRFGAPGGENGVRELAEFLQELIKIGYFDKQLPTRMPVVSFEVKPMPGESPEQSASSSIPYGVEVFLCDQ